MRNIQRLDVDTVGFHETERWDEAGRVEPHVGVCAAAGARLDRGSQKIGIRELHAAEGETADLHRALAFDRAHQPVDGKLTEPVHRQIADVEVAQLELRDAGRLHLQVRHAETPDRECREKIDRAVAGGVGDLLLGHCRMRHHHVEEGREAVLRLANFERIHGKTADGDLGAGQRHLDVLVRGMP